MDISFIVIVSTTLYSVFHWGLGGGLKNLLGTQNLIESVSPPPPPPPPPLPPPPPPPPPGMLVYRSGLFTKVAQFSFFTD